MTKSFVRFDYPSALPALVQERMSEVVRMTVGKLGLSDSFFNVELMYDRETDTVRIVEVNPRICGQFADLYQKVDGINSYRMALDVAVGSRPAFRPRAGDFGAAASIPLRVYRSCRVVHSPTDDEARAVLQARPDVLFWNECRTGDVLTDFARVEDGSSQRYGILNLGAGDREDITASADRLLESLDYRFEPLPG